MPETLSDIPCGRLTTAQAADLLGVKPATLYAYVSRGLLTSVKGQRDLTTGGQQK